jgi:hypothetical protein
VPLSEVVNKDAMRSEILRISSMGGGIFIYEALEGAAKMILSSTAGTRHIILFADAADSEHPEDYKTLVAKCAAAGITISVVGLGTDHDCDAELLKDIARRGNGQCMFTNVAQELPRLFAQDTFMIARSAFLEEPVEVKAVAGLTAITRQPLGEFPKIGGYNLCYLRPEANLGVVSVDEYKAPVVSSWQAGLGRVLCYTGEADGKFTGPIAGWKNTGDFFTSLARWTVGKSQELGKDIVATEELRNGVCRVELHLDPARATTPFAKLPELTALAARPGEPAETRKAQMSWVSADKLLAEIPLVGSETTLATVSVPGVGQATLAPVCLPYSPEYAPQKPGRGVTSLEHLAKATGGCQRLNLGQIWSDIPKRPRLISLAPYLLLTAVVVFLLEVVQRRTGIFSLRWRPLGLLRRRKTTEPSPRRSIFTFRGKSKEKAVAASVAKPPAPTAAEPPPAKEETGAESMADAFTRAQQRARKRTGR